MTPSQADADDAGGTHRPAASQRETSGALAVALRHPGLLGWAARLGLLVLAGAVLVTAVRLIGRVDWHAVGSALGLLAWWQIGVLVCVLVVRQVLNALPLAFYVPGLSVPLATVNDLGAAVMSFVAPPPGDVALRIAMFASWGISAAKGVGGAMMNMLSFYIIRFASPLGGLLLMGIGGQATGSVWVAAGSVLAGVILLVCTILVIRAEPAATWIGLTAGRTVRRVRPAVDPDAWARACRTFRADSSETFRRGFPPSAGALVGMLVADATALVLAMRFVGVDASEVPTLYLLTAYLFAFPLTIFPFHGIGLVEAAVLALMVDVGGIEVEAAALAGFLVWRALTVLGPVLMGLVALAWWRRQVRAGTADEGLNRSSAEKGQT